MLQIQTPTGMDSLMEHRNRPSGLKETRLMPVLVGTPADSTSSIVDETMLTSGDIWFDGDVRDTGNLSAISTESEQKEGFLSKRHHHVGQFFC
jgi:hypothetical protein